MKGTKIQKKGECQDNSGKNGGKFLAANLFIYYAVAFFGKTCFGVSKLVIFSNYSLKTLFYKKLRRQNFYLMFSQGVIFCVECQQILAIGCNCCLQLATVFKVGKTHVVDTLQKTVIVVSSNVEMKKTLIFCIFQ